MVDWTIRPEQPGDAQAIHQVTAAAFEHHPHSEGIEPAIVDALRADGDLTLSLVAETVGGGIIGHVAYSNAILSTGDAGWYALGPISVAPEHQGKGVGRALIEEGSALLRAGGARGVVLLGDATFYGRFGFSRDTPLHIEGSLAEYFQVLPFVADVPAATVGFAPAFAPAQVRAG